MLYLYENVFSQYGHLRKVRIRNEGKDFQLVCSNIAKPRFSVRRCFMSFSSIKPDQLVLHTGCLNFEKRRVKHHRCDLVVSGHCSHSDALFEVRKPDRVG